MFVDIAVVIAREKEIKGWRLEKKIRLIESKDPTWMDLAAYLPENAKAGPEPHSRKTRE